MEDKYIEELKRRIEQAAKEDALFRDMHLAAKAEQRNRDGIAIANAKTKTVTFNNKNKQKFVQSFKAKTHLRKG